MPDAPHGARAGLLASLSAFGATLAATAKTRLDLLALDVEEERLHFFSMLALTLAAAFCFGLATLLGTAALVVTYWFTHRLLVLTSLAAFFLVAGILTVSCARHKSATKPPLFASSRAQLDADRRLLSTHT